MWGWGVCVKPSAAKEFLLWPLEEFLKLKWCNTQQQDRQVWGTCAIKFKSQDTPQKVKVTLKSINHFFVFPFGKTCMMSQHCTGINHNNPTYAGGSRGWWHVFLQYRFSGCVSMNSMGTWKPWRARAVRLSEEANTCWHHKPWPAIHKLMVRDGEGETPMAPPRIVAQSTEARFQKKKKITSIIQRFLHDKQLNYPELIDRAQKRKILEQNH